MGARRGGNKSEKISLREIFRFVKEIEIFHDRTKIKQLIYTKATDVFHQQASDFSYDLNYINNTDKYILLSI